MLKAINTNKQFTLYSVPVSCKNIVYFCVESLLLVYILYLYQIISFCNNLKNIIEEVFSEAALAVVNAIAAQSTTSMSIYPSRRMIRGKII